LRPGFSRTRAVELVRRATPWRPKTTGRPDEVTVHVAIDSHGNVKSTSSEGNDPATAKCLEGQIARWHFPTGPARFDAPFSIVRE
jgi:hypothetical protein